MKKITKITRRDIFKLFRDGYKIDDIFNYNQVISYSLYGLLTEIDFLKKLYKLNEMPSYDDRYENAEDDIWQHTISNQDWESYWIFEDDRFELLNGSDSILLNFLCAVFHPENRVEEGYWKEYLAKINNLIKEDGYELYESDKISGRWVYSWRTITPEESVIKRFLPFSVRNKKNIEAKKIIIPTISKKIRAELFTLFTRYDQQFTRTTEDNWSYSINTIDLIIEDIKEDYKPMAFDSSSIYCETSDLELFIMNNYPYCVFDAIELFEKYNNQNNFVDEVNAILNKNDLAYKLLGGKMEISQINVQTKEVINEIGLKDLVEQAMSLYNSQNIDEKNLAVEKLWDAFERLKTNYISLNKKESAEKVVTVMSNGNDQFKEIFADEFKKLTEIGNKFRIRHHETDKIDITDSNYYDYLFHRCFALIELALKHLK